MKKRIITEGKEALERTLLMMKYDMKKTLTENVEVINEQANEISAGDLEDIVDDAVDILDRDVETSDMQKLIDLMKTNIFGKNFKGKCAYDKFLAYYKNNESFQLEEFESEVKGTGEFGEQGFDDLKQDLLDLITKEKQFCKGVVQKTVSGTSNQQTSKNDIAEKKFPCIGYESKDGDTVGHYAPAKMDFVRLFYKDSIYVYWENKTVKEYQRNGNAVGAEIKKGTWKCKSDNSDYDVVWSNNTPTQTSTKVPPITDTNLLSKLDFSYKFPGDNKYVYAYSSPENAIKEDTAQAGKWYGKNIATGKVFDITTNYPSTAAKLNSNFFTSGKAEPAAQITPTAEKPAETTATDINDIKGKGLEVKPAEPLKQPQNINLQTKTKTTSTPQTPDMSKFDTFGPSNPEVKESLKKSLKKNLIEAKEKQEDLMVENKIITNRFNFLFEGRSFETEKEKDYLVESVITEIGYLKTQGYSSQAINEGLFSMLGNIFGGSVKSIPAVFGEYIAGWLTKTLGIPQNSYMGSVIVALVGNLNIADYDKFFSDCRFASNKIADSLIEGYVLQLQNEKNLNTGASGFIVSALRNSVVDYFTEDKSSLIQILEDKIGEFLCPKLSKLSSAISDKTDDLKSKIVA